MMHKAWSSIEEVPYCFSRSSVKFQGHTGWKIDDLNPIWIRLLGRSQLLNPSDLPCCLLHNHETVYTCSWGPVWLGVVVDRGRARINSIQFQFKLDSESFNSIPIQFIFFQFQFNSNFMHRSKQINQIAGYFKFNLNISSFAAQFRKHIIPDHDNSRITKSALVWFRYWANGLVPIRQQAITWKCFIHAALAGAELMC